MRLISVVALVLLTRLVSADTVTVTNAAELADAVSGANSRGGDRTILLKDGTYTLSTGLYISSPNITISGESGNRQSVIIEGDAMSSTASVGNVITVAADFFTLENVTLQKSKYHLIQIKGESDADSPTIQNCILRDSYEQLVKVSANVDDTSVASDNGLVEDCHFEYTAGMGPQYYIGGIDAHAARNWVVRRNSFKNIVSPGGAIAEYAIHFWNDSADNLVEQNLIIDCDRGIGFGLNSRGNSRGIIRNNMIYHVANKGQFADVGIAIHNSSDTQVYNNTIFQEHSYPSAIEYRFSGTSGVLIANNLTNKPIARIDGASGSEQANITTASANWFVNVSRGDLHLASEIGEVVGQGVAISGLTDDFDGDSRADQTTVDIGADEYSTHVRPMPPEALQAY